MSFWTWRRDRMISVTQPMKYESADSVKNVKPLGWNQ
jgi:hypothetical protein